MQFILYFCSGESEKEWEKKKKTLRSASFSSVFLLANECHSFISTQNNISIVVIFYTRCQTTYAQSCKNVDENGERWTEIEGKTFYAIALYFSVCVRNANSIWTMILSCSVYVYWNLLLRKWTQPWNHNGLTQAENKETLGFLSFKTNMIIIRKQSNLFLDINSSLWKMIGFNYDCSWQSQEMECQTI